MVVSGWFEVEYSEIEGFWSGISQRRQSLSKVGRWLEDLEVRWEHVFFVWRWLFFIIGAEVENGCMLGNIAKWFEVSWWFKRFLLRLRDKTNFGAFPPRIAINFSMLILGSIFSFSQKGDHILDLPKCFVFRQNFLILGVLEDLNLILIVDQNVILGNKRVLKVLDVLLQLSVR